MPSASPAFPIVNISSELRIFLSTYYRLHQSEDTLLASYLPILLLYKKSINFNNPLDLHVTCRFMFNYKKGAKQMKSLKEVCSLTGVSRRALQGYASKELQLLPPTVKKGDGKYWYYDSDAIIKLSFI